jgi:hypothetical protein
MALQATTQEHMWSMYDLDAVMLCFVSYIMFHYWLKKRQFSRHKTARYCDYAIMFAIGAALGCCVCYVYSVSSLRLIKFYNTPHTYIYIYI